MALSCIIRSRKVTVKYDKIVHRYMGYCVDGCGRYRRGLVLGVFAHEAEKTEGAQFTPSAEKYNSFVCNKLRDLLKRSGTCPQVGEYRLFYDVDPYYNAVALVGLGKPCKGYNEFEDMDEGKEVIRTAAGLGARVLQKVGMEKISVEDFEHSESAAEGSALAIWLYQEFKHKPNRKTIPLLDMWESCDWTGWQIGLEKAAAQNLARELCTTPANVMTPTIFSQKAVEVCCQTGINVEVKVRRWLETQNMGAFLLATKGSCQVPIFLELSYYGTGNTKDRPIILIGSGSTFCTGGICLKHPGKLKDARGDMTGAACVLATCRAIASMNLCINVRGLIPLCENMVGCNAMKPGDVAVAMNGKNILVEDARLKGRLMIADALTYAQKYWPLFIVDVGTMTKSISDGLSTAATGVFSNSDSLWNQLRLSAAHTGDRVWRMPLFHMYQKMLNSSAFDMKNRGRIWEGGNTCKCAGFLKHFVPCGEWMHMDNYGTMVSYEPTNPPYYRDGFTGRPTRTIIEFVSQCLCQH